MRSYAFPLLVVSMILLTACSGEPDVPATDEGMLLRYFPPETNGVVFIDFAGLREHPFMGAFVEEHAGAQAGDEVDEFQTATGFDFGNDVRQVMAGSAGDGRVLIVVSADYDPDRVADYFVGEGLQVGEHGGTALFRPGESGPDDEAVLALLGAVVLVGVEAEVRDAIDRAGGSGSSALENAELLRDIAEVGEGYQIWATGRVDTTLIPGDPGEGGPANLLRGLERGSYPMRVDDTITARAIAEFASAEQAGTAASLLEGLRGMAMLQGVEGEFAQLLNGIMIASNDDRIEVQIQIDTALLEQLAESGALSR
jgi:hypothetical protein